MKLGYFTHTNISPSETFILDLIEGMNNYNDIKLTVFGGQRRHKAPISNLAVISTGYYDIGLNTSFFLYKVGQLFRGRGNSFKNRYQQRTAFKCLTNNITERQLPDVAFVDYGTSAVLCYKFLEKHSIPFVVHVHGYDVTSALNDKVYKSELIKVFNSAHSIVAASHYIRRILILTGCPSEKIQVSYHGIPSTKIRPLDWSERRKLTPSLIFLGRLTSKKHPIALLHSFQLVKQKVPEVKLTIIGDGPIRNELEARIKSFGLSDSVELKGVLNRKESFPLLNTHWIYVQHSVTAPSGDQEGFAISLAEAALHELPVVSTFHNGIPENVINGKTGLLVNEFDFESMAEKIIHLIQHPAVAEKMGKSGREHILKLCDPDKRTKAITKLLFNAAEKKVCKDNANPKDG